jgi:hypothetical protein
MGIINYPKFGTTGGFSQVTDDTRIEQSELVVSNTTMVFQRSLVKECTFVKSSCAWGIEYGGEYIIDTVTIDIADEIDPAYTARSAGEQTQTDLLIKLDCCKIIRGHVNIAIDGKGNPNIEIGSIGSPPFILNSAIGNLSLNSIINVLINSETVNYMFVGDYKVEDKETDWETFHVEYKLTVNSPSGESVALPFIMGEHFEMDACEMSSPHCNSYKINYGLFAKEYSRITAIMIKHPKV